jgi:hypothetical protein
MGLVLALVIGVAVAAKPLPHVFLVISDDLGYNDLGYKNGNKTLTPTLNQLVSEGVRSVHIRICAVDQCPCTTASDLSVITHTTHLRTCTCTSTMPLPCHRFASHASTTWWS